MSLAFDPRCDATALEVRENGVRVRDGEGMEKIIPADTVVNCLGMKARRAEVQMH
jgi:glycine/D-amino acid oxidase-like deaminating enzyme